MKKLCILLLVIAGIMTVQADGLRIASLHPLLSEMAREIGGEQAEVVDLFPANGDLHSFSPGTRELGEAAGADFLLALGKNAEPYLRDLRQSLSANTQVLELGATVPDVLVPGSKRRDPHWWNTPENMKRSSRALYRALTLKAPQHRALFTRNWRAYTAKMDSLAAQARVLLSRVPAERRVLVSGHAAMCHFCQTYGFEAIPVHGIAKESEGDTATMARLITTLRERRVPCIFVDMGSSPRALNNLAEATGATTAPIVMDGIWPELGSYEAIFLHNIRTIVKGLAPELP